jgi:hypothetical protein
VAECRLAGGSQAARMTAVRVRKAGADDATAIAVVHVLSWQAAYEGLVPQDCLDGLDPARRRELWDVVLAEGAWPRSGVLVAENEDRVAGFAAFRPARDQDEDPSLKGHGRRSGRHPRGRALWPPKPSEEALQQGHVETRFWDARPGPDRSAADSSVSARSSR